MINPSAQRGYGTMVSYIQPTAFWPLPSVDT